jgi:hypothetical protein
MLAYWRLPDVRNSTHADARDDADLYTQGRPLIVPSRNDVECFCETQLPQEVPTALAEPGSSSEAAHMSTPTSRISERPTRGDCIGILSNVYHICQHVIWPVMSSAGVNGPFLVTDRFNMPPANPQSK